MLNYMLHEFQLPDYKCFNLNTRVLNPRSERESEREREERERERLERGRERERERGGRLRERERNKCMEV